jgi:hypothetical protein
MTRSIAPLSTCVPGHYYVEGSGWFVVRCRTKRIARSWGVKEFGRGHVHAVRQATTDELSTYKRWKGMGMDALPVEDHPE